MKWLESRGAAAAILTPFQSQAQAQLFAVVIFHRYDLGHDPDGVAMMKSILLLQYSWNGLSPLKVALLELRQKKSTNTWVLLRHCWALRCLVNFADLAVAAVSGHDAGVVVGRRSHHPCAEKHVGAIDHGSRVVVHETLHLNPRHLGVRDVSAAAVALPRVAVAGASGTHASTPPSFVASYASALRNTRWNKPWTILLPSLSRQSWTLNCCGGCLHLHLRHDQSHTRAHSSHAVEMTR